MSYVSEPVQRLQLRNLANQLREILGLTNEFYFPVIPLLEGVMPPLFEGFYYEIVPVDELPPNKHADTDVVNRIIRIREDVYYGATDGNGRDRMTIMHEIAHYLLMVVCGVKFARVFDAASVATYKDPEWQAKALAGEIMCPNHLIRALSVDEIMDKCGVSMQAASLNLKISKGGDVY